MRVFGLSKRTSTPTFTSILPLSRMYLKRRKYRLFLQTQPDFALTSLGAACLFFCAGYHEHQPVFVEIDDIFDFSETP